MSSTFGRHRRTARVLKDAVQDFTAWGALSFVVTSIFALPAVVVLLIFFSDAGGYFLTGLTMLSIKFAGSVVNDSSDSNDALPDTSNLTRNETLLLTVVMYTITASMVSTVLLTSSTAAGLLGYMFDLPLAAVIVAAIYPWFDAELSHLAPKLSVGRFALVLTSTLLSAVVTVYGLRTDVIERAAENELHLY